ncbi:hypothetical protein BZA05DRAFT_17563 [Tricharina praecox]|uniref:uncharacterized protein n=1 Tax=Tricharina praecox TaxID=43433 RepID=UPI002220FF39|nr:uncharacterized protein BZA05DRAFT_17563 [Tricharina praecox]KAI5858934.1 hypothetical protein BZA05DRAFT_17563 [Tricharina praecox]
MWPGITDFIGGIVDVSGPAVVLLLLFPAAIICISALFRLLSQRRRHLPIPVAALPVVLPIASRRRQTPIKFIPSPILTAHEMSSSTSTTTTESLPPLPPTTTATADRPNGLLTPPTTPAKELQDPYAAFLALVAPAEMADAPVELLHEVVFADTMEGELMGLFGGGDGGLFASSSDA